MREMSEDDGVEDNEEEEEHGTYAEAGEKPK